MIYAERRAHVTEKIIATVCAQIPSVLRPLIKYINFAQIIEVHELPVCRSNRVLIYPVI